MFNYCLLSWDYIEKLKKRTKTIIILIAMPIFIGVLYYFGMCVYNVKFYFPQMAKQGKERRIMLLYRIDHAALLDACRKLIKEKREGKWQEGRYDVSFRPHPDAARLPERILKLKPTWVWINNERVMIEMFGGLDHFGIQAFSRDFPEADQKKYGHKKLLDGLWYYDDGYRKTANYDQYIESLRPE